MTFRENLCKTSFTLVEYELESDLLRNCSFLFVSFWFDLSTYFIAHKFEDFGNAPFSKYHNGMGLRPREALHIEIHK